MPGTDGEIVSSGRICSPDCKIRVGFLRERSRQNRRLAAHTHRHAEATQQCRGRDDGFALDPLPVGFRGLGDPLRGVEGPRPDRGRHRSGPGAGAAETIPNPELRIWADAFKACVESHIRDAEILIPWARLDSKDLPGLANVFETERPSGRPSNRLSAPSPSWRMHRTDSTPLCVSFPCCALG